ncbi:MAG: rhodanese-like domain-containing protein [Burkholderiaceae bacterium]
MNLAISRAGLRPARLLAGAGLLACSVLAGAADFRALVSIDPSDNRAGLVAIAPPNVSLSRVLWVQSQILVSHDLKDAMRASRTGENQMIIAPVHVTASALNHGYRLAAVSGEDLRFALVVRDAIKTPEQLRGARLYLPQQDSLRSYMAKGLLEQNALSFKSFKSVQFGNTSGAGLVAIALGMADATVSKVAEAEEWMRANPNRARVLMVSREVPGGLGISIHKSVSEADRAKLILWATATPSPIPSAGVFKAASSTSDEQFAYVASLGIVTPETLSGVTRVMANEVRDLMAKPGAVVVDTRSAREYAQNHIPGAVSAPYGEKSLKERDYNVGLDDLSAIGKLDRDKPTVFLCNGPECWKSYKASRGAINMGFKTVYWFRGGMPEWDSKGFPTTKSGAAQ